jgi:ABC-2 type transport system permease protein
MRARSEPSISTEADMNQLDYLFALARTALKASLALRAVFVAQATFMAINNLLYFSIWWVLLERFPSIGGYTLADMALLFGVCASGFGVAVLVCGGMFQLGRHIGDGDLDAMLCQPRNVLWRALASHSQASGFGDIASGFLLIALSGHVPFGRFPVVLLAVALSATTLVASCVMGQALVFWLGRVERLSRTFFEFVLTLATQPPTLFSGGVKLLMFTLLPAAFVSHVPANVIRDWHVRDLGLATAGTVLYAACTVWVFGRGLRRYESGSRFGVWG